MRLASGSRVEVKEGWAAAIVNLFEWMCIMQINRPGYTIIMVELVRGNVICKHSVDFVQITSEYDDT